MQINHIYLKQKYTLKLLIVLKLVHFVVSPQGKMSIFGISSKKVLKH